jgi:hypothetical protein
MSARPAGSEFSICKFSVVQASHAFCCDEEHSSPLHLHLLGAQILQQQLHLRSVRVGNAA